MPATSARIAIELLLVFLERCAAQKGRGDLKVSGAQGVNTAVDVARLLLSGGHEVEQGIGDATAGRQHHAEPRR